MTRPLVLRLLLRAHAQAAGVWKTDAANLKLIGHTSLSTTLVIFDQTDNDNNKKSVFDLMSINATMVS